MARISSCEILWNTTSRTCFQDRVMPYAYWFKAINDRDHREHKQVLDQSISMLTGSDFVQLIGEKKFVGVWKDIRDDVNINRTAAVQGKIILDGLWSSLMTGFAFGSRNINIDKPMSRQLKVTYLNICQNSDRNIYQVARNINRPYNRVYADVKRLQEIGLIKALSSIQTGRKVSILSAT